MGPFSDDEFRADLRVLLDVPAGRRVLWRTLRACLIFAPSYAQDPLAMAHNEGLRSIGLALKGAIDRAAPQAFAELIMENTENMEATTNG